MTKEKQKSSSKYIVTAVFVVTAVALYWFWAFPYRAALSYREQLQLFQTTGAYFAGLAGRPAGIAVYIGEFLTQTFNNYWMGAAVMTGVLILFMWLSRVLVYAFAGRLSALSSILLALTALIPLWLFLGDPDVTLAFPVALILTLAGTLIFIAESRADGGIFGRGLHMLALTSFLYWLAGPVAIVFTLMAIVCLSIDKTLPALLKVIFTVLSLAWLAVNVYIWASVITYPFSYQLIGIGYLMKPDVLNPWQILVEGLCILIPCAAPILWRFVNKSLSCFLIGFAVATVVIFYPKAYDRTTYRLIDYDYMVRANDWDGILRYSDKHNPDLPLSVSATNLAMGMTGQLDARAFDYFQNGAGGLMPAFSKETLSSWTTGEILFQLGMVNSAQRFYFEGMEAIPNYNKSARALKRLAETAIIRGDYKLAAKYLRILENTTFYRRWARRNLKLIKDPQAVASHPLYGTLRSRMVDEDYLFSEGEVDKTLGQLYLKDSTNTLAKQYLMLYPLLQRDLNKFVQYMGVIAESDSHYNPLLAQQAAAFMAMKSGQPVPQGLVSPAVEQALRGFAQAWTSRNPDLIAQHRHTLYHYLISND